MDVSKSSGMTSSAPSRPEGVHFAEEAGAYHDVHFGVELAGHGGDGPDGGGVGNHDGDDARALDAEVFQHERLEASPPWMGSLPP